MIHSIFMGRLGLLGGLTTNSFTTFAEVNAIGIADSYEESRFVLEGVGVGYTSSASLFAAAPMKSGAMKSGPTKVATPPTPYEDRYRQVYEAGGARFYPKKPSSELETILQGLQPGLAVIPGCGEGRNIGPFVQRGWEVVAIDSAGNALEKAREDYRGAKNVRLVHGDFLVRDLCTLDIEAESVDFVAVINLLHLILFPRDRRRLYQNIYKMLRRGGIAFFENNGRLNAPRNENLKGGYLEPRTIQTPGGEKQIHLERFPTIMLNGKSLRRELRGAGLIIDEMRATQFQHPDTLREQILVVAHK